MLQHSKKLVEKLVKEQGLTEENLVIEIASNDGYLLQYFNVMLNCWFSFF